MLKKVFSFWKENQKWRKAGKPFRTEEKISALFEICNKCEHIIKFTESDAKCNVCGCRLSTKLETMNKLAWSTTKCPLDEPKWIEEEGYQNLPEIEDKESTVSPNAALPPEPTPPVQSRGGCGCGG